MTIQNGENLLLSYIVLTVLEADRPLLELPAAQAGWQNITNLSQQEDSQL